MHALAMALAWAAGLCRCERNPAEVDRLASELIELSTRHNFVHWLANGAIWRGWARSASGDTVEGIPWIDQGIRDYRVTGSVQGVPYFLALKAEALFLADRSSEALEAINEAEALAERFERRNALSEMHRLRGMFLAVFWAPTRYKLRLHFAQPSESHGSRNRLHWRKSEKQPTRRTAAKKRPPSEGKGSDYLFDNFLQFPGFRSFVQRPAHEIPRRSPPSCPHWNDANAIMNAPLNVVFMPNTAQKIAPNDRKVTFKRSETRKIGAQKKEVMCDNKGSKRVVGVTFEIILRADSPSAQCLLARSDDQIEIGFSILPPKAFEEPTLPVLLSVGRATDEFIKHCSSDAAPSNGLNRRYIKWEY